MQDGTRALRGGRDDYYTLPSVAASCVAALHRLYPKPPDLAIEPAAGSGAFLGAFRKAYPGALTWGIDVHPTRKGIGRRDWFTVERVKAERWWAFGNPPFGFASSNAVKFFNHAADLGAEVIAFIVPLTFRKDSIQRRLCNSFRLRLDLDLIRKSFHTPEAEGQRIRPESIRSVPCCFQVWERLPDGKTRTKPAEPDNLLFDFTPHTEVWDHAIRRVGGRAGKELSRDDILSPSTTLFLRAKRGKAALLKQSIGTMDLTTLRDQTAGVRSVSKRELARELNTMSINLLPGKAYTMSAKGRVAFMNISETMLHDVLRDGRISGLLLQYALESEFRNVTAVSDGSAPYDLILSDDRSATRWEHKVATNGKASLIPSYMKGSQRKFDAKAFRKWIKSIDGVIVSDITAFPDIVVRAFSRDELEDMGFPTHIPAAAVRTSKRSADKKMAGKAKTAAPGAKRSHKKKALIEPTVAGPKKRVRKGKNN